jgi:hypothetical protein
VEPGIRGTPIRETASEARHHEPFETGLVHQSSPPDPEGVVLLQEMVDIYDDKAARDLSRCIAESSRFYNQAAPLSGAGSGAPRAGLWPWRGPARRARAVPASLSH